ncbi:MAG: hypothetical protein INR73_27075 [Williamsia sp.]|nr:hypothetical protein [Williamsia sp.]
MKKLFLVIALAAGVLCSQAQEDKATPNPRPITMAEYDKAKTYAVKDLDKDTYVKFENTYIVDRYEMKKPYFITGDDGLKKRIDLYKLVAKDGMQELGTLIYYTNEKGKRYTALQPNFTAEGKVWEKYFEDIHSIDKEEKNFVLKLSYILSKEMSFQLYKSLNQGKDLKDEAGTYGSDICFPGTELVAMADGSRKMLSNVKPGDQIMTVDAATKKSVPVQVTELVEHKAENYAITQLLLLSAHEKASATGLHVHLVSKVVQATPNHPMMASGQRKSMGEVNIGDQITCQDRKTHSYHTYTVYNKTEKAGGVQKVYNMVTTGGSTFILNDVMVMQK